jgi:DNA topoisomerase-2
MNTERHADKLTDKYEKLTDVEHVLLRPEVYMGDTKTVCENMFIFDKEVSLQQTTYNAGVLKLFDEVLMNAVDNYRRSEHLMSFISVDINRNSISVRNDGLSIPISFSDEYGVHIPELIFTQLRTGSNFNDTRKKNWAGKNGLGVKLANIFSNTFKITIVNNFRKYTQLIKNNNNVINPPTIEATPEKNYVEIYFEPDLPRFNMSALDSMFKILKKRVHDLSFLPIHLSVNSEKLPFTNWENFVKSYKFGTHLHFYEKDDWKIAFGVSEKFMQVSFVNNIATYDGGTHVKGILDQILEAFEAKLKTKNVKNFICLFISVIVINPEFTSQAKDKLSSKLNVVKIPDTLLKKFVKESGILEKFEEKLVKAENRKLKQTNPSSVKKLIDAPNAGTREGSKCALFLCEGDSALTMCVRGMKALPQEQRDYFGAFPLRGKPLNCRDVSNVMYFKNEEWNNVKTILGLKDGVVYDNVKPLRYGKIICAKDADADGASIMGLIINFFDAKFPSLLKIRGFISEFVSPMIKVIFKKNITLANIYSYKNKKGTETIVPFYNEVEYKRFITTVKEKHFDKFIKGLGTNEDFDIEKYFEHYKDNTLDIMFDDKSHELLDMAFNKKRADDRKEWLKIITPDTHLPRNKGVPITCSDFINNDLVLFSYESCVRAIPSVMDGLKPSQRKIMYSLFQKGNAAYNDTKLIELAGDVMKSANYHHGDQSLHETIIKLAQDYPGANNLPLLEGIGQFGSRRQNGDDTPGARYISARLHKNTRRIFPEEDDILLEYRIEDNKSVEPFYYIPIIPFVLINGAEGIGTGYSTSVPPFNLQEIIRHVKSRLYTKGAKFTGKPFFNNFKGVITETPTNWVCSGKYTLTGKTLRITELPLGKSSLSIEDFSELLKEYQEKGIVSSWRNYDLMGSDFVINLAEIPAKLEAMFKLKSNIPKNNMYLFNGKNQISFYPEADSIIQEWFNARYELYLKRILYKIEQMTQKILKIKNQKQFILDIIEDRLNLKNISKESLNTAMAKYDKIDDSHSYLLDMSIHHLTREKFEVLCQEFDKMNLALAQLEELSVEDLWMSELDSIE